MVNNNSLHSSHFWHDSGLLYTAIIYTVTFNYLKTLDTIGYCQKPVSSLGVSQHMHTNTKPVKDFELNWSSKLRDNHERKNTPVSRNCVLLDA